MITTKLKHKSKLTLDIYRHELKPQTGMWGNLTKPNQQIKWGVADRVRYKLIQGKI
ncbi:hypothetical protein GCM10025859_25400 [Alicyclobacillus fastidiosus]|nr:hypothetical protein GCM10025859_25400 [Alicyclobacillus fastidiosus]